jgi:hypothetical protein
MFSFNMPLISPGIFLQYGFSGMSSLFYPNKKAGDYPAFG